MDPHLLHMLMRELERSTTSESQPDEEPKGKSKRKKDEKENA